MQQSNGTVAPLPAPPSPPATPDRRGVRPRELARQLGVAPGVIYRAIGADELSVWRLGATGRAFLVIPAEAVDRWLASKADQTEEAADDCAA